MITKSTVLHEKHQERLPWTEKRVLNRRAPHSTDMP